MKFKEVQELFFKYEEKRHELLEQTQTFFLKKKFRPYVWFDEKHRLRIKHKYPRNIQIFTFDETNRERAELYETIEEFVEQTGLRIRFIQEYGDTDKTLPEKIQTQWTTEFILEV